MAAIDAKKLSSAACALLGIVPVGHAGEFEGWDFDASTLYYQESDGRVQAVEPVLEMRKQFQKGRELDLKFTLDALTGATPNGALPSTVAQTFTRPSGNDQFTVAPGETPLDDTFRDTRVAVAGTWLHPFGRYNKLTIGTNFSKEYDFTSMGGSLIYSREFNQKNTTLQMGVSTEIDSIDPVGNVPKPLATMRPVGDQSSKLGASEDKTVVDLLLGVTQILNRRTLMQLNYSMSRNSGYLNDPYKILTRLDPSTDLPVDYVYENRPDTRLKHALYWLTRYHLDRDIVSGSYRYFFDDWGIKSHTVDLNYHWKFATKHFLEPHVRFYTQSEADFYRTHLVSGAPLPLEASADYRLADFNGLTYGFNWGWNLRDESQIIIRLEYYIQTGAEEAFPDLNATIAQIQYRF